MQEEQNEKNSVDLISLALQVMKTPEENISLPTKDVRSLIDELVQLRKEQGKLKSQGNNFGGNEDDITSETSELTQSYCDNEGMDPFLNPDDYIGRLTKGKSKSENKVNSPSNPSNLILYFARQVQDLKTLIKSKNNPPNINRSVSSDGLGRYEKFDFDDTLKNIEQRQKNTSSEIGKHFELLRTYLTINVTNEIKNLALDVENLRNRVDKKKPKRKSLDNSTKSISLFKKSKRGSLKGPKRKKSNGSDSTPSSEQLVDLQTKSHESENKEESDSPTFTDQLVDLGTDRRSRSFDNIKDLTEGGTDQLSRKNPYIPNFPSGKLKKLTSKETLSPITAGKKKKKKKNI